MEQDLDGPGKTLRWGNFMIYCLNWDTLESEKGRLLITEVKTLF